MVFLCGANTESVDSLLNWPDSHRREHISRENEPGGGLQYCSSVWLCRQLIGVVQRHSAPAGRTNEIPSAEQTTDGIPALWSVRPAEQTNHRRSAQWWWWWRGQCTGPLMWSDKVRLVDTRHWGPDAHCYVTLYGPELATGSKWNWLIDRLNGQSHGTICLEIYQA